MPQVKEQAWAEVRGVGRTTYRQERAPNVDCEYENDWEFLGAMSAPAV